MEPTFGIYIPAQRAKSSEDHNEVSREEHAYGPLPRQKLDLFLPQSRKTSKTKQSPVLVFIYGGGFVAGEKRMTSEIYSNLGRYFAEEQNFVTVIPDYRLTGPKGHGGQYPSGGKLLLSTFAL